MSQESVERLARLEANLEFIKDYLKEMREDVKGLPTKDDYDSLESRVKDLEKNQVTLAIKVGSAAAVISLMAPFVLKLVMG